MKISNQLKELMKKNDVSITQLATNMNTSQPNVTSKLLRDNFKLSDIKEISDGLGYDEVELVLRGHNETVIIREDESLKVVPDTQYLVFDETESLIDDIKENGFRDKTFKELVMEAIIENSTATVNRLFSEQLLSSYVPNDFIDGFKEAIRKRLLEIDHTSPQKAHED